MPSILTSPLDTKKVSFQYLKNYKAVTVWEGEDLAVTLDVDAKGRVGFDAAGSHDVEDSHVDHAITLLSDEENNLSRELDQLARQREQLLDVMDSVRQKLALVRALVSES